MEARGHAVWIETRMPVGFQDLLGCTMFAKYENTSAIKMINRD